jgi:hypothetical protein
LQLASNEGGATDYSQRIMPSSNGCVSNSCCGNSLMRYSSLPHLFGAEFQREALFALLGHHAL